MISIFLLIFIPAVIHANSKWYQPEQIHISYGENIEDLVVTWSTFNKTEESIVEYGLGVLKQRAFGNSRLFVDGGWKHRSQYIHKVKLTNLRLDSLYSKFTFCVEFLLL